MSRSSVEVKNQKAEKKGEEKLTLDSLSRKKLFEGNTVLLVLTPELQLTSNILLLPSQHLLRLNYQLEVQRQRVRGRIIEEKRLGE